MHKKSHRLLSMIIILSIGLEAIAQPFSYPFSKQEAVIDEYHGHRIVDPYRWLEHTESVEVQKWMKTQDQFLKEFIAKPQRLQHISSKIESLENTGTNYGVPQKAGKYYYYNSWPKGLRHALIHQREGREGTAKVIVDLNTILDPSTVYRIELETGTMSDFYQTFLTVYRIELETGTMSDFYQRTLSIDHSEYVSRNTYYESFDETKVPIYSVHKQGIQKGKGNPVYMYAYGFGVTNAQRRETYSQELYFLAEVLGLELEDWD